jgi:hypothetical protein
MCATRLKRIAARALGGNRIGMERSNFEASF